jgi:hypothetical protein
VRLGGGGPLHSPPRPTAQRLCVLVLWFCSSICHVASRSLAFGTRRWFSTSCQLPWCGGSDGFDRSQRVAVCLRTESLCYATLCCGEPRRSFRVDALVNTVVHSGLTSRCSHRDRLHVCLIALELLSSSSQVASSVPASLSSTTELAASPQCLCRSFVSPCHLGPLAQLPVLCWAECHDLWPTAGLGLRCFVGLAAGGVFPSTLSTRTCVAPFHLSHPAEDPYYAVVVGVAVGTLWSRCVTVSQQHDVARRRQDPDAYSSHS